MEKSRKVAYIASKYTDTTKGKMEKNLRFAERWGKKLTKLGYAVISPLSNSEYLEDTLDWRQMIKMDLAIIKKCDLLIALPNWRRSRGARLEVWWAKRYGVEVKYWDEV